jgi:Porin subfamily
MHITPLRLITPSIGFNSRSLLCQAGGQQLWWRKPQKGQVLDRGPTSNHANRSEGGGGDVTGVNQFSYTADFGGGVSATISAQDQVTYYTTNVFNTAGATAAGIATGLYGSNALGCA